MTDYIEKKVADFVFRFGHGSTDFSSGEAVFRKDERTTELAEYLRTALQEALLAGVEMAEGIIQNPDTDRQEAIYRLAALKKEVADRNPNK